VPALLPPLLASAVVSRAVGPQVPRASSRAQAAAATTVTVGGSVLVRGARTNADAVVSLEAPGLKLSPPAEPLRIDQKGFRFLPRVLAVQTGTKVRFLNNDNEPHNVYSPEGRYNLGTWARGDAKDHVFGRPGAYSQLCRIHPDMLAYVVVLDTPYFAVTDATGAFTIRNVPPGSYTLVAWHEKKDGLEQRVNVESGRPLRLNLTLER